MNKLLLGTAAIALGLALATPAKAEVNLGVGGYFKGYGVYTKEDGAGERRVDILRDTEVHFSGETTLDNGLTVGAHIEADADAGDSFAVDESYTYFSGAWGRTNFGTEDGAAYLLQVAAPSADSNVDGIRSYVDAFSFATLDYDNDATTGTDKLTYLTPVFSGFQAGVSYTPDTDDNALIGAGTAFASNSFSVGTDDVADEYGEAWEGAVRYEGQFEGVGLALGAGYTDVSLEADGGTGLDDFQEWNVGADLDIGAFGLGVVYTENNNGDDVDDKNETWVVGGDYTNGPYKLGLSWLNNDTNATGADVESDRYAAGVVYTYGPGMTFRGSVNYTDVDAATDTDGTAVLLGTQIDF